MQATAPERILLKPTGDKKKDDAESKFDESGGSMDLAQYLVDRRTKVVDGVVEVKNAVVPACVRKVMVAILTAHKNCQLYDAAVAPPLLRDIEAGIKGAFLNAATDAAPDTKEKRRRRDHLRALAAILATNPGPEGTAEDLSKVQLKTEDGTVASVPTFLGAADKKAKDKLKALTKADIFARLHALLLEKLPARGDDTLTEDELIHGAYDPGAVITKASTKTFDAAGSMRSWHADEPGHIADKAFNLADLSGLSDAEALYCIYILIFKRLPGNMSDRADQGQITNLVEYTAGSYAAANVDGRFILRWQNRPTLYFTPHYEMYGAVFKRHGLKPFFRITS
jgi:hypothetical protein